MFEGRTSLPYLDMTDFSGSDADEMPSNRKGASSNFDEWRQFYSSVDPAKSSG
jgi:hypothetical protein